MSDPVKYSVVIPAYNEEQRLPRTLGKIAGFFEQKSASYEIIVVSDGSRDHTLDVAKAWASGRTGIRVLANRSNRGKGASVRRGVAAARGKIILFSDADLSTPIEEFEKLEAALQGGAEAAIASRALAGSSVRTRQPLYREMMGKLFNLLARILVLPGIHDTQCGFKAFRREPARRIFRELTIPGFGFDVEALYLAKKHGLRVREVPVVWHNDLQTKVSPLRDSFRMFCDLFRIRLRHGRKPSGSRRGRQDS